MFRMGCKQTVLSSDDLHAYHGLQITALIVKVTDLKDYWSTEMSVRVHDFKEVLKRDTPLRRGSSIMLNPSFDPNMTVVNRLWQSRNILQASGQNADHLVVLASFSSMVQSTIECKARRST